MVSRRTILSLLATAPTAGCTVPSTNAVETVPMSAVPTCGESPPWPAFQGGPRRLGRTSTTIGSNPESRLVTTEAFPAGRTGRLVCTDNYVIVTWEQGRTAFRYHISTGVVDSLRLDHPVQVYPAAHCSTLVVATDTVRYLIDAADWQVRDEQATATPHAAPLFDGDRFYVTGSGGLQAVGVESGPLWTYSNDRLVTGMASTNETVYAVESNAESGRLTALDAETGGVRWRTDRIGETYADPVVGENIYVTNAAGRIFALEPGDGGVRWTHRTGTVDSQYVVPAVGDNALFIADEGSGSVRALGRNGGETRWETPILRDADGKDRARTLFAPVLTERGVLVGASSAGVVALSQADGRRLYRGSAPTVVSPLAVAGETIYGATPSGLFLLDLSN